MRPPRLLKIILRKPDEVGVLEAQAASITDPEPENETRQDAPAGAWRAHTDLLDHESEE